MIIFSILWKDNVYTFKSISPDRVISVNAQEQSPRQKKPLLQVQGKFIEYFPRLLLSITRILLYQ
jgi:hypothetical protein